MKLNMSEEELYNWVFKVNKEFYELIYQDPWFKKIFRNIKQEIITSQQTDFIVQSMGGPQRFCGRSPKDAHPQIWIDEYIWNYRNKLLQTALKKINPPSQLQESWIKIDNAFKNVIIKKGGSETLKGRYKTDEIIYEPIPHHLK